MARISYQNSSFLSFYKFDFRLLNWSFRFIHFDLRLIRFGIRFSMWTFVLHKQHSFIFNRRCLYIKQHSIVKSKIRHSFYTIFYFKFFDIVRSTFVLATFVLATFVLLFRNALWDLKISRQTLGRAPKGNGDRIRKRGFSFKTPVFNGSAKSVY